MSQAAPLRVVLTGGIASGKSTVAALFAALGVPIIDTDVIAREVVAAGTPLLTQVVERFGPGILQANGELDRVALRQIVFADAQARRDLEALLHPAIRREVARQSAAADGPYQMLVVPLWVEGGGQIKADRVVVVDCDPAQQLHRLMARDGGSQATAKAILAAQATREARLRAATHVIHNDADVARLRDQVSLLHNEFRHPVYEQQPSRAQ